MMHLPAPAVAKALAALFTALWWWIVLAFSVLVALVPLGRPAEDPEPSTRLPLDELVHWDAW